MRKMYLDAIQNVGCAIAIVGFWICLLFVHYIESLYITGIVLIVIGIITIGVVENIPKESGDKSDVETGA